MSFNYILISSFLFIHNFNFLLFIPSCLIFYFLRSLFRSFLLFKYFGALINLENKNINYFKTHFWNIYRKFQDKIFELLTKPWTLKYIFTKILDKRFLETNFELESKFQTKHFRIKQQLKISWFPSNVEIYYGGIYSFHIIYIYKFNSFVL